MLSKKAQTSTEYLIILAIVVVIALVVVGVMGGVPTLGGGSTSKISAGYWKTADIGIETTKMTADNGDNDIIVIKSNLDVTAEITEILINNIDLTEGTDFTLTPGATKTLTANISEGSGTAGDAFSFGVSALYTDKDNDVSGILFNATEKLEGEYQ